MTGKIRLLIIDDEATLAQNIERYMATRGYDVRSATSGENGLAVAEGFTPDVAIVDYCLPGFNGLETVERLRRICPGLRTLLITAHGDPKLEQRAAKIGVWKYLTKPLVLRDLKAVLDSGPHDTVDAQIHNQAVPPGSGWERSASASSRSASSRNDNPRRRALRRAVLPLAASVAGLVIGLSGGYYAKISDPEPPARARDVALSPEVELVEEIADYYLVFIGDKRRPFELDASHKPVLDEWFSERLGRAFRVPDLSEQGLTFVGGRLLAIEEQSASLLLYKSPTGQPVGVCITDWGRGMQPPQTLQRKGTHTVYWVDDHSIFVLLGWTGPALLWDLIPEVERSVAPPHGGKNLRTADWEMTIKEQRGWQSRSANRGG